MKKVRLLAAIAATLSLLLGAVAALAQDSIKVDPNNKLLFENDRVRVYEVKSPPGNTLAMHSHPAHVVYFVLQGITMKSKSVITVENDSAYRIDVDALHDGKTTKEVLVARRTGDC